MTFIDSAHCSLASGAGNLQAIYGSTFFMATGFHGAHVIIGTIFLIVALARTIEFFRIPRDTLVICLGKSTYARCGIIVNVTPLEPEWEGQVTREFTNTTPLPAPTYAKEGVEEMVFFLPE